MNRHQKRKIAKQLKQRHKGQQMEFFTNRQTKRVRKLCNDLSALLGKVDLTLKSNEELRDWFLAMATELNKRIERKKAEKAIQKGLIDANKKS